MENINEIEKLKYDLIRYSYEENRFTWKLIFKALSHIGFWAVLNYRVGKYLREKVNLRLIRAITGLNKIIIEILTGISIPYSCQIGEGLLIGHFSGIMIGSNVKIGKNVTLHQNITLGAAGRGERRGEPIIGNNVFIGAGAVVLGNVIIEDNVAIGANAVVTDDIPNNAVVVSQKAKIISYKGSHNL